MQFLHALPLLLSSFRYLTFFFGGGIFFPSPVAPLFHCLYLFSPPALCCNPDSQFHLPVSEQSSWMYIHMNWLAFFLFFFFSLHHAWRRRIKTIDGHNAAGKEKRREINLGSESRWAGDTCIVSHKISCEMKCGEREKTPEDMAGLCNLLLVRINKWKQGGVKGGGPSFCAVFYLSHHNSCDAGAKRPRWWLVGPVQSHLLQSCQGFTFL